MQKQEPRIRLKQIIFSMFLCNFVPLFTFGMTYSSIICCLSAVLVCCLSAVLVSTAKPDLEWLGGFGLKAAISFWVEQVSKWNCV